MTVEEIRREELRQAFLQSFRPAPVGKNGKIDIMAPYRELIKCSLKESYSFAAETEIGDEVLKLLDDVTEGRKTYDEAVAWLNAH